MNEERTHTLALVGQPIFAHCAGSPVLCLSRLIWLKTVTASPWARWPTTSPLRPAWLRMFKFLTATSAAPGASVTVGSVNATAGLVADNGWRFLWRAGVFFAGAFVTSGAGATIGVGAIIGAGISGSAFVLFWATALV